MRRILTRLKLHKTDEMERMILFKAQRNAYFFLTASLLIWTFYESWRVHAHHSRLNLLPCLLMVSASLIQTFTQLILTRRAVQDDEDSFETGPLMKLAVLGCIIAGVVAAAVSAVVLMGVRA